MATSLFVLFREYADQDHMPSSSYIECTDEYDANVQLAFCEEWLDVIRFFKYETCNRYYDLKNIRGMLYPYILLDEEYGAQEDEYPNLVGYIRAEFKKEGLVDWKDELDGIIGDGQKLVYRDLDVTNDVLGVIVKVKRAVLLNCGALKPPVQFEIRSNDWQLYYVDLVGDIPSLHKWFSKNRDPQRTFVYNPKHGDKYHPSEYIPGTTRKAAQLKSTREDAQKLLELAISNQPNDAFWYYDTAEGKYIYFENQQEIRLAFHGYHLSPGEENFDNIDRRKLDKIL